MAKVLAKVAHLYAGLDLIGSKTSLNARDAEIEVTEIGLKMTSRKTKRIIGIPWSNVKGYELFPEEIAPTKSEEKKSKSL